VLGEALVRMAGRGLAVDCVGGVAEGGIPLVAAALAEAHHRHEGLRARWLHELNGFWIRRAPKEHGLRQVMEGNHLGRKAILLEDVVTTGRSVLEAIEAVKAVGGPEIVGVISLLHRDDSVLNPFASTSVGVNYMPLMSMKHLGLRTVAAVERLLKTRKVEITKELAKQLTEEPLTVYRQYTAPPPQKLALPAPKPAPVPVVKPAPEAKPAPVPVVKPAPEAKPAPPTKSELEIQKRKHKSDLQRQRRQQRYAKDKEYEALQNRSISVLGLSRRCIRCLKDFHVTTIAELVRFTGDTLLRHPNFGPVSLAEIRAKLAVFGFKLADERDP
jgi:orotate phosphoribosyltransferase